MPETPDATPIPVENDQFDAAPVTTPLRAVPPEWIDYNGHMNVAYYSMAFDQALDHLIDTRLGVGVDFVKRDRMGPYVIQSMIHYMGELLEGEEFYCEVQLLDHDHKRLHLFLTMKGAAGDVRATSEQLIICVDLQTRRSASYPPWAMDRITRLATAHATLTRPDKAGATIGIRRR